MKAKITKLTKEQEELLAVYARKGVEIGLSCDPIDEDAARDYGARFMKWLGREHYATIIVDSPYAACYATHMLAVFEAFIDGKIERPVWAQVGDQVRDQVRDQVWDQVRAQVWDQVWAQVRDQVWDQVGDQGIFVWPHMDGGFYAYYVAWYRYLRDVPGVKLSSIWQIEDQANFGCVYPLRNFVVVARRPEFIHKNTHGLHCDGGAALRYADGFSVHSLNGVRVPEWLAVKRMEDIDPAEFATLSNAETRREFVRKVGMERIYQACGGKILDSRGDYELVEIDLKGDTGYCPYLKMKNPSIGVWHLEGVPKGTKTVIEALNWRNQSALTPSQLT